MQSAMGMIPTNAKSEIFNFGLDSDMAKMGLTVFWKFLSV
jgi:hypothetical protein